MSINSYQRKYERERKKTKILEKMMEERTRELFLALEKSEHLSKQKSEYVANISHELRTPMHSILSFAEIALKKAEKGEPYDGKRYLKIIYDNGLRLLHLLDDLLSLSKSQIGKLKYSFFVGDIRKSLNKTVKEISSLTAEKNLKILYHESPAPLMAEIDEKKMEQVFFNVIANAIKFSPIGSEIVISHEELVELSDGKFVKWIVTRVCDEGPGIPEDELELVFEKFSQSSRTKSGAGGSGLGLAISREIIEGHNGKIWASNNEKKGATVSLALLKSNDEEMEEESER